MARSILYTAVASLMLGNLIGCASLEARRYERRMSGKPAPDFELKSLDGETVKLSALRGQPVLLAFWGHG